MILYVWTIYISADIYHEFDLTNVTNQKPKDGPFPGVSRSELLIIIFANVYKQNVTNECILWLNIAQLPPNKIE